jgi:hypothetical protein
MYDIRDLVRVLLDQSEGYSHVVYDMQAARPPRGNATPHLRKFVQNLPMTAREGLHAFVGANPDWKAHLTLFMRMNPELALDVVYVSSVVDARGAVRKKKEQIALLEELDDDTDDDKAVDIQEMTIRRKAVRRKAS